MEQANGWLDLVKAGLSIAQTKGILFQDLQRKLSVNMKAEPDNRKGYAWHPELKLSIQGFDAAKGAENLYRLARLLNEELYVRLYWREEETAAHPG